jgi:hypothetical protein
MALAKAEEGKNRQNYDDETDEIDKSVHELAPLYPDPTSHRQFTCTGKVPQFEKERAMLGG